MKLMPGDEISYEVFYLEMLTNPDFENLVKPSSDIYVVNTPMPSSEYFFHLYAAVGSQYEWTDKYDVPIDEIKSFLSHSSVKMFTLFKYDRKAGFFILDKRIKCVCDLSYFGLVPEAIGFGFGEYLLKYAVKESWKMKDINCLTVNTNTLDHPKALPLYKKLGFKVVNIEKETRTLTKPRYI